MKAQEIIQKNRKSFEELNSYHQEWIKSNKTNGLQCLDYEEFLKIYNMTDREIIETVMARGVTVDDADEFFASLEE